MEHTRGREPRLGGVLGRGRMELLGRGRACAAQRHLVQTRMHNAGALRI